MLRSSGSPSVPRGPRPQSVRVERERDENGEGSGSSSSKQRLDLLEGEGRYEMHVFANLGNGNGTNGSEEKRNSGGGTERKVTIGHPFGASEDVDEDEEEEEEEEGQDEKRWWGADTLARRGKARDSLFGLQENATKGRGEDSRRSSTSSLPDNLRQGHGVRWDPFPPHTIGGTNIPGESTSFGETTQSGDESQSFEGTQLSFPSLASVSATDYPSTPHPGAKTPLPRELRLYRHHSTSSSIPQFTSNRDADDNMSHFSGRSRQPYRRTLPPSRRPRHSSQDSSIPQFLRNRSPSPSLKSAKTQRRMTSPEILQNFKARNIFDEERGEGEPSSPPAQSALDDTSIMIISAGNGEPSIFEPSMFKAASVAATRASTGSLWSTYTYPKPLVLPELDDDLREGRYEFDDDNMFRPIDWTGNGNGNAGNAAARNADDGQRRGHPFVEESPKRRWRDHPLKRIAEMGRLRR
ncbi:hypothetical protein BD410DRAFT_213967 [Rickenella mellea]|uniref:Uncharacterized protein n=1 Tax=Rickenella mellea TaxID=50990 RepID=A0A4Y7PFW5_9AGAM|nr:hypothetical protein BD410DRAFT_213967 [Rickenella mellea]